METGAGLPAPNLEDSQPGKVIVQPKGADLQCPERSKLVQQYDATVEAYTQSIKAMIELKDNDSGSAFQRVLEIRNACETLRTALKDHERDHKCATGAAASA
jgi:hypothetical protein